MKKEEFLTRLERELYRRVPRQETEKALLYYGELIDDAIDSGKPEEQFIASLPYPDAIAFAIGEVAVSGTFDSGASISNVDIRGVARMIMESDDENVGEKNKQALSNMPASTVGTDARAYTDAGEKCDKAGRPENMVPQKDGFNGFEGARRDKKENSATHKKWSTARIVGTVLFCIFALPIVIGLTSGLCGLFVGLWAAAGSLLLAGILTPVYAVAIGILGSSFAVFLAYFSAGMFVLALGIFGTKFMIYFSKGIIGIIKGLGKGLLKGLGG